MDPLTAVCNLANAITTLIGKVIEKQPPDVAAQLWRQYLEDVKAWREFWGKLGIGAKP